MSSVCKYFAVPFFSNASSLLAMPLSRSTTAENRAPPALVLMLDVVHDGDAEHGSPQGHHGQSSQKQVP
ncbi:hypothetical protein M404DRAFT_560970 [Pisolithus tinctorius Marx 270]|uniref:Uncharacterized protein n=1 Tax=Pisolithus tinctorius Marx 270 TaxID=870435 RepID=A0A0C3JVH4_PISTI|nr:hypothetical protein M404DRAFT_560970 [Pisolithus tinctorius Marx 270]